MDICGLFLKIRLEVHKNDGISTTVLREKIKMNFLHYLSASQTYYIYY